jgi:hypothetical protein
MKSRVLGWLALLIVLSCVAFLWSRRREVAPPKIRDISGGAKTQRERIDRAIATAGNLNIDEAISSLSQNNDAFGLAGLASLSPASPGHCFMKSILADRRISKIFEHLSSLPAKEADNRSQKIFEEHFSTLHEKWKEWGSSKTRTVGTLLNSKNWPKTAAPHHAASAGLFLCSYFCSREVLDSNINRWNDTLGAPDFENLDGIQMHTPTRMIDPLFHLNLLVISGHRHQRSVKQLNKDLESLCQKIHARKIPFLQVTQMKMFKWNAETLDTDFTHVTRGIPASGNSVLLELPGFADPNSSLDVSDPDVAKLCENCIRTWRDR